MLENVSADQKNLSDLHFMMGFSLMPFESIYCVSVKNYYRWSQLICIIISFQCSLETVEEVFKYGVNELVFKVFAKLVEWTIGYVIMRDLFRTKTHIYRAYAQKTELCNILVIPKAVLHLTYMAC